MQPMKVVGIFILLLLGCSGAAIPDYEFCLVWEIEFEFVWIGLAHFADIDSNGLLDIIVLGQLSGEENPAIYCFNPYGKEIFRSNFEFTLFFSTDLKNDGTLELFYLRDISGNEESNTRIEVLNAQGDILWWYDCTLDNPYFTFHDITDDGVKEIFVGNLVFDAGGNVLQTFAESFECIGVGDFNEDGNDEILLLKQLKSMPPGEDVFQIVRLDGEVLWEYHVTKSREESENAWIQLVDVDADDKKEVVLVRDDLVYQLSPKDFSEMVILQLPEEVESCLFFPHLEVVDIDGDGNNEYTVYVENTFVTGREKLYQFDENKNLLWTYKDVNSLVREDLENDGKVEFIFKRSEDIDGDILEVLDCNGEQRWWMFFDDRMGFEISDIDNGGEKEIVTYTHKSSNESYIHVFNPQGELKHAAAIEQNSIVEFNDFDSDNDLDLLILTFTEYPGSKLCLYSNSLHQGVLDEISDKSKTLQKAPGGRFEKGNLIEYTWKKFTYALKHPLLLKTKYNTEALLFLLFSIFLFIGSSFYATRFLKKRETEWNVFWSSKKFLLYFVWYILLPPLFLIYFIYKIFKSPLDYRKALGFTRITRRDILISVIITVILLFVNASFSFLLALSGTSPPDISGTEYLVKNYLAIAFMLIVVTAPIGEEIVVSGHLYPILRSRFGVNLGILLTALLFSAMHLELILVPLFLMGALVKTYAYERTHCIYIPMMIHFINNLTVVSLISFV